MVSESQSGVFVNRIAGILVDLDEAKEGNVRDENAIRKTYLLWKNLIKHEATTVLTHLVWEALGSVPKVAQPPNTFSLNKDSPDAFFRTGLNIFLRSRGVEKVVVSGFLLENCVAATAVGAARAGYDVTVVRDCSVAGLVSEKEAIKSIKRRASSIEVAELKQVLPQISRHRVSETIPSNRVILARA